MVGKTLSLILLTHFVIGSNAQNFRYLHYVPSYGIAIEKVVTNFGLESEDKDSFLQFNNLGKTKNLIKGKKYKMPVRIYALSKQNIRSSIAIDNYHTALSIQKYNQQLEKKGIKKTGSKMGEEIWVPIHFLTKSKKEFEPYSLKNSLFGKKFEKVEVIDNKLQDHVFYLLSGHGGPDPGANCKKDDCFMCEDEYAYDIVLRLARNLISHGAKVYMIVKDENDGIRDESCLEHDHDEVTSDGKAIPLNQIQRLKQRTDLINKLYRKHKGDYKQQFIELHIDSRDEDKKIDLFFYHFPESESGKKLAEKMLETVRDKYNLHQKERNYEGIVKERNLYSLRQSLPVSVYIEVGNITNEFDQKRILIANNRQALANWLTEGLMK